MARAEVVALIDAEFDVTLGVFHLHMAFTAPSGSTTVLLGESGCGKSTVLKLLAGLLKPDEGHFILDGEVYADTSDGFDVPARERPVGFVFQDYVLFPHLSVFDNVAFGLRMQRVSGDVIRERVAEALEQVHLVGYDDRRPGQLSGGQQQRVAIARALALKPHLLLLDESLAALDIQTRRQVQQELREILSGLGLTAVMVSHQYEDALVFGDQIIVLDAGKVLQSGQHLDLLLEPRSPYVAAMVGVNLFSGRTLGAGSIALATGVEVKAVMAELEPQHEVSVVIDPPSITLHESEPVGSGRNVMRGEIVEVVPVSSTFSGRDQAIEGVMRVGVLVDPDMPPLRVDVNVTATPGLELAEGTKVFASFAPEDTRAFP